MSTPHLSVVIPSYNETKNLDRGVLEEVIEYLKKQTYSWEVVLSDDGSTDGTVERLEKFVRRNPQVSLLKNEHAGKGPTVQAGMLAARGTWRLFTDFDQSTPLSEIERLWPWTEQHYEVMIGSREAAGAHRQKEPLHRHIMGKGFNAIVQVLAVPGIWDTQCGFKLFSAKATEELFPKLFVYGRGTSTPDAFTGAFDVEVLFIARKYRIKMKEIPIRWQHNETDRVNPIKDSLRMLRDIIKVRMADAQGQYKR